MTFTYRCSYIDLGEHLASTTKEMTSVTGPSKAQQIWKHVGFILFIFKTNFNFFELFKVFCDLQEARSTVEQVASKMERI